MYSAKADAAAATTRSGRRRSHWSPPSRAMSDSSSGTIAHRKYVDPWDLDLREVSWRHSSDTTDCSADQVVSLSSAAGPESTRSDFVYVPGPPSPSKTKSGHGGGRTRARSVVRYDCCQCSPKSSLALLPPPSNSMETYECWDRSGCKRQQPQPYRYAAVDDRFYGAAVGPPNQCRLLYNASRPELRRNSRYNNSDADAAAAAAACRAYETSSGEYDSAENVIITSQFGYNTLGHMKIDYSSNWNNLDKYICQV